MRSCKAVILGIFLSVFWGLPIHGEVQTPETPIIEIDMPTYDFGTVTEGEVVEHKFWVFNRGGAPLEIKEVKPG